LDSLGAEHLLLRAERPLQKHTHQEQARGGTDENLHTTNRGERTEKQPTMGLLTAGSASALVPCSEPIGSPSVSTELSPLRKTQKDRANSRKKRGRQTGSAPKKTTETNSRLHESNPNFAQMKFNQLQTYPQKIIGRD